MTNSRMTNPIILAHGIAPYDQIFKDVTNQDDDKNHYFREIRSTLKNAGFSVFHSEVDFAGSVDIRAKQLKKFIEKVLKDTGKRKVHIIAHSMGGLDARHMLYDFKDEPIHAKVASLTTIGTPHLGTSFADRGITHTAWAYKVLDFLDIHSLDGFKDLTTQACAEFNKKASSYESTCPVTFRTYAGKQNYAFIFSPLRLSWLLIKIREGDNDGLVSVNSAKWKDEYFVRVIDADHLNEIGRWDLNESLKSPLTKLSKSKSSMEEDIKKLYLSIAEGLEKRTD